MKLNECGVKNLTSAILMFHTREKACQKEKNSILKWGWFGVRLHLKLGKLYSYIAPTPISTICEGAFLALQLGILTMDYVLFLKKTFWNPDQFLQL